MFDLKSIIFLLSMGRLNLINLRALYLPIIFLNLSCHLVRELFIHLLLGISFRTQTVLIFVLLGFQFLIPSLAVLFN